MLLQWAFLLDQRRHLETPTGPVFVALLLIQSGGIALALTQGVWLRLGLCLVLSIGLIAWARRNRVFPPETVAAVIPGRLAVLTGPALRLLCRCE
jgi:hypothetical protein